MNYVGNTISIPIWYDQERIYVPSVDIPQKTWNLIWTLTPIVPTIFVGKRKKAIGGPDDAHNIESITFNVPAAAKDSFRVRVQGMQAHNQSWLATFENNLETEHQPVAIGYSICISGFPCHSAIEAQVPKHKGSGKKETIRRVLAIGNTRIFDPVVIAQPDPIYP